MSSLENPLFYFYLSKQKGMEDREKEDKGVLCSEGYVESAVK